MYVSMYAYLTQIGKGLDCNLLKVEHINNNLLPKLS